MRMTIDLDDQLLFKAFNLAGLLNHSEIVNEGLEALIQRESNKQQERSGGAQPAVPAGRRRRAKTTR